MGFTEVHSSLDSKSHKLWTANLLTKSRHPGRTEEIATSKKQPRQQIL